MANGLFNLKQVVQAVQQGGWPAQKTPAVEYLVVAGGGGGVRGGGGAGGLLVGLDPVPNGQTLLVTVGAGGTGRTVTGTTPGGIGGSSVFGSISPTGGGGGGTDQNTTPYTVNNVGQPGGSGGGGPSSGVAGVFNGGAGVVGQGNYGGSNGGFAASPYPSGGGGGAGTVGLNATLASISGNGGAGIASAISGTVTTYAGGGGGGNYDGSGTVGTGGVGGGGSGALGSNGANGTANTGGGGGGSSVSSSGGNGGSGIVIVSYPDVYAAPTATTGSPTVSTSGSGSVIYSGTGQYLSTPSNSGFNFGTGDFTIECWFNSNNVGISQKGFIQTSATAGGLETGYTTGVSINFSGSGTNTIGANVGSASYFSSVNAVTTGTWYHIAITRQSGTVNVWLNGVSVASGSGNTSNLSGTYCVVGGYYNTSYLYDGYLSNVRVIKGTALYTTTFTPSSRPLTAISGTSLLMNTVSGAQFADGSSNSLVLTATGTPTWNQLSPFTATGYKNRVYTWTSSGSITF